MAIVLRDPTSGIPLTSVASTQTVVYAEFVDSDVVSNLTVVPGAVSLTFATFVDTDTISLHIVSRGSITIIYASFIDSDVISNAIVTPGSISITFAAFVETDVLSLCTVIPGAVTVIFTALSDVDDILSLTVIPGAVTLVYDVFVDTDIVHLLNVTQTLVLHFSLFASNIVFYAADISVGDVDVILTVLANNNMFRPFPVRRAGDVVPGVDVVYAEGVYSAYAFDVLYAQAYAPVNVIGGK